MVPVSLRSLGLQPNRPLSRIFIAHLNLRLPFFISGFLSKKLEFRQAHSHSSSVILKQSLSSGRWKPSLGLRLYSTDWPADKVRATFFNFFANKDHSYYPSSPTIPQNDPTLMFANAGMNQVILNSTQTRGSNLRPSVQTHPTRSGRSFNAPGEATAGV